MSSSPGAPPPGSPATVRVTGSLLARSTEGRYSTPVTLTSLPRRPTIGSPTTASRSSSTKLYTSTFGSMVAPSSASSAQPSTITLPAPSSSSSYSVARQPVSPATSRLQSNAPVTNKPLSLVGPAAANRENSPLTLGMDPAKVTPHVGDSSATAGNALTRFSETADNNDLDLSNADGTGHALSRKRDAHTIHLVHSGAHVGSPLRSPTGLSRSHTLPTGYNARMSGVTDSNNGSAEQSPSAATNIPHTTVFFAVDSTTAVPEVKVGLSPASSRTSGYQGTLPATVELSADTAEKRSAEARVQFNDVTVDLLVEAPVDDVIVSSALPDGTDGTSLSKNSANGRQQQLKVCPLPTNPTSPLPKNRFSPSSTESESRSPSYRGLMPASISMDESSEGESCHTFGVPLSQCPPSSKSRFIPLVVELCLSVIEERGITNQGIYRVPGNKGAVHALELELNKNIDAIDVNSDQWQDVNAITSLLKMFFRKLPEPLITEELYEPMITANRVENAEKRMLKMKKILHEMPEHNFETFRYLAQHLDRVTRHGDKNKMDAHNLSIIFGPTLIRTKDDNMTAMVNDMNDQCRIIETIILHFKWFFSSWDEDVNVPEDKEAENVTTSIGAFSEQLARIEGKDKDISAKDVVSSIFSAANKRIRSRKDRTRGNDLDSAPTDCSLTSRLRGHHGDGGGDAHNKSLTFTKDAKDDSGYVKFEYVQRREDKAATPARDT